MRSKMDFALFILKFIAVILSRRRNIHKLKIKQKNQRNSLKVFAAFIHAVKDFLSSLAIICLQNSSSF